MFKKHFSKIAGGALTGFIAALLVWILANYIAKNLLYSYEAKTYDWRVEKKIIGAEMIEDIIIVDIDERSIQKLGRYYNWHRDYHTEVVNYLSEGGAAAIGLDILYDPFTWDPEQDEGFIDAIEEAGNVYNALYFAMADSDTWRPVMSEEPEGFQTEKFYYQFSNREMQRFRKEERFESEFTGLLNASRGVGHVNFKADIDGTVRGIHTFTRFNNHLYPALAFEMFLDLIAVDSLSINDDDNYNLYRQGQLLGEVPVDKHGNMLINWAGTFKTFRYISFYDVYAKRVPKEYFNGKIIFVGTSLAGLFDLRNVPFMQAFPGVEIHANILNTLRRGEFITKMGKAESFAIIAGLGILTGVLLSYTGLIASIVIMIVFAVLHVIVSSVLFLNQNLWIEIINPLLTISLTFTLIYVYRYLTEEKNKRFIKDTFQFFVHKSVIDELLDHPEKLKLGGEKKVCTVLFSDVAGFTTITERLSKTPEALVNLLNEYLTEMADIVFKYDGMVDKYEGDAIMAVFGAPVERGNHAANACATAVEMQERLIDMRKIWRKQGKPALVARVGINTGEMIVGNMGSKNRFDYTVMGDSVNLGARLEPANKQYNTLNMIGEETYKMAGDLIIARPLDYLGVVGKERPVKVFELLSTASKGLSDEMYSVLHYFGKGFEDYLNQNWDGAIKYFQQALQIKSDDGPSLTYVERCNFFKENPPGEGWDKVYRLKTK